MTTSFLNQRRNLRISTEFWRTVLGDMKIRGANWDPLTSAMIITVVSEKFNKVPEGETAPLVDLVCHTMTDDGVKWHRFEIEET